MYRHFQTSAMAVFACLLLPTLGFSQAKSTTSSASTDQEIGGKKLHEWIKDISHPDPGVRWTAMQVVIHFGAEAHKAVPALVTELGDRDPSLRANAAFALGYLTLDPHDASGAFRALGRALSDQQQIVRFRAAMAIAAFGNAAKETIPQLVGALNDYNASWEVRKAIVAALGITGTNRDEGPNLRALASLRNTLKDPCALVRGEALKGIILMGKPAVPAELQTTIASVKKAAHDRDKGVSLWANVALMRLDHVVPEQIQPIVKTLKSSDLQLRLQAARALETVGPEGAEYCVQDLIDCLGDHDADMVVAAIMALRQMGPAAAEAVSDLRKLKQDGNESVRQAADAAIKSITEQGKFKSGDSKK
jgi:HEAT repeat protein